MHLIGVIYVYEGINYEKEKIFILLQKEINEIMNYYRNEQPLSLHFLSRKKMKKSICIILSDSTNIDEKSFKIASLKHDIIFFHISSSFENTLDGSGLHIIESENIYKGINLDDNERKAQYKEKIRKHYELFEKKLKSFWVDSLFLDENSSPIEKLMELMRQREK